MCILLPLPPSPSPSPLLFYFIIFNAPGLEPDANPIKVGRSPSIKCNGHWIRPWCPMSHGLYHVNKKHVLSCISKIIMQKTMIFNTNLWFYKVRDSEPQIKSCVVSFLKSKHCPVFLMSLKSRWPLYCYPTFASLAMPFWFNDIINSSIWLSAFGSHK